MNLETTTKKESSKRRMIAFGTITKGKIVLISVENEKIPAKNGNHSRD